jgi:hypothetical protein
MQGTLSAERLYFYSSFAFAVAFVIYMVLWYVWPLPMDPAYIPSPTDPDQLLNTLSWMLSWAGIVMFLLGFVAKKS